MANPEWLEIFQSFTPAELAGHIATLKRQISVFTSQNVGSKSYVKDLNELRGQLSAAIRIQKAPQTRVNQSVGITDFNRINDRNIYHG